MTTIRLPGPLLLLVARLAARTRGKPEYKAALASALLTRKSLRLIRLSMGSALNLEWFAANLDREQDHGSRINRYSKDGSTVLHSS